MHRLISTLLTVGFLFSSLPSCPGQSRTEFKPESLREMIRELVPKMSRSLDIRVYEPIPIEVVDRNRLQVGLTMELQKQLMQIQKMVMEPKPGAGPVLFPDQARRIAEKVAGYLAPLFFIRHVYDDDESHLLVVPSNLDRHLDPNRIVSRQIRQLIQFALVRELTRMADFEKRRFADEDPPMDNSLEMLAARLAFQEGHASWAASSLVRNSKRHVITFPRSLASLTNSRDENQAEILLYAMVGKGRERARLWVEQCLKSSGLPEIHRRIHTPPTAFGAFPSFPVKKPKIATQPDPLVPVVAAMEDLCTGNKWTVTPGQMDKKILEKILLTELPARRVRVLISSIARVRSQTAHKAEVKQIHLTVTEMNNPSAAFSFLEAQRDMLLARRKRMEAEGMAVQTESDRTRDLSGYPVLRTSHVILESEGGTMHIHRAMGIRGRFYLEISSTDHEIPWSTLQAFFTKIQPLLDIPDGISG